MMEGSLFAWKVINILTFLFFLMAALAQFNDDDACMWIPVYIIPAALSLAIAIKPNVASNATWLTVNHVHYACCICFVAYILLLLIQTLHRESSLDGKKPVGNILYYEEGRELVGLILVLSWLKISKSTISSTNSLQASTRKLVLLLSLVLVPLILWSLCFVESFKNKLTHCRGMEENCHKDDLASQM